MLIKICNKKDFVNFSWHYYHAMKPFFYQLILPLNSALSELYKSVCAVLPCFRGNLKPDSFIC